MILITRPQSQANITLSKLEALGYSCRVYPLLTIRTLDFNITQHYDYVIITSQNAAQALCSKADIYGQALVVGTQSTRLLENHGYKVISTSPTAESLYRELTLRVPKNANILYLSGSHTSFPMRSKVRALGYNLAHQIIYQSLPATTLPSNLLDGISTIMFYSPRTSQIFHKLCFQSCTHINAICISDNTAIPLTDIGFKSLSVARKPDEESMMELIYAE